MPSNPLMSTTVAIIGAGPLGRWLALHTVQAGYRVLLEDVMPASLLHAQEELRRQLGPQAIKRGVPGKQEPAHSEDSEALRRIEFVSSIEDAVRQADLVIDCVPDEIESKLEIFWLLDRMAPPRAVLATPTMRQSIADLASCTYRPGQCVAILAEAATLATGSATDILLRTTTKTTPETVSLLTEFWRKLGYTPRFETDPAE
jgi:3-hydroxybutyryl-CoA dehydrogenase